MQLQDIIIEKIHSGGPMSFRDFMEMALYYPGLGYYTSDAEKIGIAGDYYTSPYYTNIFGELIGRQLEEMWHVLGEKPFTIVEYGAGPGLLCRDILGRLKQSGTMYEHLEYCIIEKSAAMRSKAQQLLKEKVRWVNSIDELAPVTGCILSNELLDNFAVHVVMMQDELMELFVDYQNDWVEIWRPASHTLIDYFVSLGVQLPAGYRTEVNLHALDWTRDIANALKKGFVLTIDYGSSSTDLYSPQRKLGTMLCYHKHGINDHLYQNIGQQDITTHVNFSALVHQGALYGLQCAGFTNQAHFLQSLGLSAHLRQIEEMEKNDPVALTKKMSLINTFLMNMGKKLKVLVQSKGVENPMLSGLQFASKRL